MRPCASPRRPTTRCAPRSSWRAAGSDAPDQGRRVAQRPGHPAEVPGEHPRRPAPRRPGPQPARAPRAATGSRGPADEITRRRRHPRRRRPAGVRPRRAPRGRRLRGRRRAAAAGLDRRPRQPARASSSTSRSPTSPPGKLPEDVDALAQDPEAWVTRWQRRATAIGAHRRRSAAPRPARAARPRSRVSCADGRSPPASVELDADLEAEVHDARDHAPRRAPSAGSRRGRRSCGRTSVARRRAATGPRKPMTKSLAGAS